MKSNKFFPGLLILILLIVVISNFFWLHITDLLCPTYSSSMAMSLYQMFKLSPEIFYSGLKAINYYPPFYAFTIFLGYLLLGACAYVPIIINMLYLSMLVFFIYKICSRYQGNGGFSGFLGGFIVLSYPSVAVFLRAPIMEYALCAWVAVTLYLFIQSEYLSSRRYSLFLGIALGIGMLIKWTFIIYVIGIFVVYLPIKYILGLIKYNAKMEARKVLGNLLLLIIVSLIIVLPWYIKYIDLKYLFLSVQNDPSKGVFLAKVNFYIRGFKDNHLFIPFFLFFLLTWPFALIKRKPETISLSINLIFGIAVLSLIPHVEVRYLLPFMPYIALLTVLGLFALPSKFSRRILFIFIFCIGIYNFIYSFSAMPLTGGGIKRIPFYSLKAAAFSYDKIIDIIKKDSIANLGVIQIAASPFNESCNYNAGFDGLGYRLDFRHLQGRDLDIKLIGFDSLSFRAFPYKIDEIDYLVVSEDVLIADPMIFEKWRNTLREFNSICDEGLEEIYKQDSSYRDLIRDNFTEIGRLPSFLGSDIVIFKK